MDINTCMNGFATRPIRYDGVRGANQLVLGRSARSIQYHTAPTGLPREALREIPSAMWDTGTQPVVRDLFRVFTDDAGSTF